MSWPGFYSFSSAWLFLLLIPLLIFYFLKLKRPRQEVPSLALWRQVINDQRVNSPFQKFKRNLLLLLQLLLLALLILAAMQPFMQSGAERAEYLPVLVDCSASMSATDKDGVTRLDAAKIEINKLIDNMLPDQQMSLVGMTTTARRLTEFTNNKRLLRASLAKLVVADVPAKIEDALRMTQALSRSVPIDSVLVFSDGNFPQQVDFALPFDLNFQKLKPAAQNIGVTEFNASRGKSAWDVFVRVQGSDGDGSETDVMLFQDGEEIARESVVLDSGESQRLVFPIATDEATSLELRLKPGAADSLASDNSAFIDLPVARSLDVFCPTRMVAWRHAFNVFEDLDLSNANEDAPTLAKYDVVVTDRLEDLKTTSMVKVVVGVIPPDLEKLVTVKSEPAEVVDWDRSDGLFQHVNLGAIDLVDKPESATGVTVSDYEELGYQIVVHGDTGPLVLKKRIGAQLTYFFLFHTERSTLPYNLGFPIVVANSTQMALQQASLSKIRGQTTGVLPTRSVTADSEFTVVAPDGSSRDYNSDKDGLLTGVSAPLVGRYKISDASGTVANVGVGLLNPLETTLKTVDQIDFPETEVSAADTMIKNDRPLWPILAALAFVVLLVEWWFFQKRPAGVPT